MRSPFRPGPVIKMVLEEETAEEFLEPDMATWKPGDPFKGNVTRQYVTFSTPNPEGGVINRSYSANEILGLEDHVASLIKTIEANEIRAVARSRMESDRTVLWHTVDEVYNKLMSGRQKDILDSMNLLMEAMVSCSPPSLGEYPTQAPITPLTIGTALSGATDAEKAPDRRRAGVDGTFRVIPDNHNQDKK